jgi:oligopeptide/dipeptide ABC transporter ATP-binding protein
MDAPLLDVRNLRKWYEIRRGIFGTVRGHVRAVDDVSFAIGEREVLGLAGESGSGKTTIGRSILRLIEPTAGAVLFRGDDITRFSREELRLFRRKAQIVFQDPYGSLDPRMTIAEILAEPFQVQQLCASRREMTDRIVELLALVAIGPEFLTRRPGELSGGQRQRIGIARAIAVNPSFLVADEPVSALDVSIQAQVINLLGDLKERLGLALLFISHDIAVMAHLSDRIAVMYLGKIMEIGPSRELVRTPSHPYTIALLSAVPNPEPSGRRGRVILEGDIPSPAAPPSGCVFRTRCPYAIADCAATVPVLREVAPRHLKACIRDDVGPGGLRLSETSFGIQSDKAPGPALQV